MRRIPCILLSLFTFFALAVAGWSLYASALLPSKLVLLLAALFILLVVLVCILTLAEMKTVKFWLGVVLALTLIVGAAVGSFMLNKAVKTMRQITATSAEFTHVGIYVKQEDPAATIEDTKTYTFGVLENRDWGNTAAVLAQIREATGVEPQVRYYGGLATLANGFQNGESNALILNVEYLKLISELEGIGDIDDWTRELTVVKIVQETEPTTIPTTVPTTVAEPEETTEETLPYIEIEPEIFAVYLSGNDTTGEISDTGRSDSNIIAIVNTGTRQVLLISTPRDSYVSLPIADYAKDKLTHAGIYGIQSSIDTLSNLYGIKIDYYFRVNFTGFKDIINALGGITVHSDFEFVSFADENFVFRVGDNEVDGTQALVFARDRYSFVSGDYQRGKNQMEVIKATAKKMCSPAILKNYTELLSALAGSFYTNIPYEKMAELCRLQIQDPQDWDFITVNPYGDYAREECYSTGEGVQLSVVKLYNSSISNIKTLINQMLNGEVITQPD